MSHVSTVEISTVRFVKELYPRIKADDDAIERYRQSIELLPPIVIARDGIVVDGYHRWQAHVREGIAEIKAEDLGNLSDAEIMRESITRNATHGQQLSNRDKQFLAQTYYSKLDHLPNAERISEIAELLAVNERSVQRWTKDARKAEKQAQQDKAWEMHLHCFTQQQIADALNTAKQTVNEWLSEKRQLSETGQAPGATADKPWGNVQHFDVWSFASNSGDAGAQSYFGACPPQVLENLLWLYTTPGESVVVDPFAGTGTTLEVAHRMGRRAWVSDIRGNHNNPQLTIHQHDITTGWHPDAPKADLIFLDPPYWKQAAGRYSQEPGELAEMTLDDFNAAWLALVKTCKSKLNKGGKIALIISPTEDKDAGVVVDHAFEMAAAAMNAGLRVSRRVIVTYQTQQATGQQVTWARENRRLLKLYRDLVIMEVA